MDGFIWSLATVFGVVLLGIAIAVAIYQWRTRPHNPTVEAARDQATREHFREEKSRG